MVSLCTISGHQDFSIEVPFDAHGQVVLGLNAYFEMRPLAFDDLVRSLQWTQEPRFLGNLGFFLDRASVTTVILQLLNLLKTVRVLAIENDVLFADYRHLGSGRCFPELVIRAAGVISYVSSRYVFDSQRDVSEIEERRNSRACGFIRLFWIFWFLGLTGFDGASVLEPLYSHSRIADWLESRFKVRKSTFSDIQLIFNRGFENWW